MTRHQKSLAPRRANGNSAILTPLRPVQSLTQELVERLRSEIATGRLLPGERLPTEQSMGVAMGVSRTVVREAVAALKADGLVITRQGSGAFVSSDTQRRGFLIDPVGLGTYDHVLQILELRLAIEVEAAALASLRAPGKAVREIDSALKSFGRAVRRGESAVIEDFAFHRAIAVSTTNPQFTGLLEFLGLFIIPRQSIRAQNRTSEDQASYLEQIYSEHQSICTAIMRSDPDAARESMRAHLTRSGERYRAFGADAASEVDSSELDTFKTER